MKKLFNPDKIMRFLFMFLLLVSPVLTKADAVSQTASAVEPMTWFIYAVLIFVLLVLLFILYALNIVFEKTKTVLLKEPLFAGIMKKLTDTVPVEQEEVILTDHVYDGIRELDNNLPPWWKYLFYATIVFSGVYLYFYEIRDNGYTQEQEYNEEMVMAEKEKEEYMKTAANSIDESNVKLANAKGVENGKVLYIQNCAACHGQIGEGGVGPNLTDEYWLHGGGIKNVFKTIKYGVPQNGMISWKSQLSPSNIQDVASYIMSIQGSNPANGKAPQGDKYQEQKEIAANEQ
jgi:cytochrome c oxidase cbb3-type subunit 3